MGREILLVDDEEGIRRVLGISLRDSGYEVLSAASGEEALEIFRARRPPIILTDIKMPGMDGIELLQRVKREVSETEVIMVTGHGDMDLAIQSLKFDATDFITKPINDDALEIALKRANEKILFRAKLKEYTENLERLVEEKSRKLVETERLVAVGQTVAGLAHAIKNISGGLTGGGFVLEKGVELGNEKYVRQGWDMVRGNVERIKAMALDLLNYAKEREPDLRLCDPNRPAREVAEFMLPQARKCDVRLELGLDEYLAPAWIDPEGIHRCLLNLVSNAVDACGDMKARGRAGVVWLRSGRSGTWAVEYEVEDNGCGMDAETREKVFQTFFSTKGSRGTGLGLMITRKIIAEHEGVIVCASEEGRGSKFTIRLPGRRKNRRAGLE